MRPRTSFVAALVAFLLVLSAIAPAGTLAQTSGQVIGEPDISFSTSAGALSPGTTTQVPLTVTNRPEIRLAGPSEYQDRVSLAKGLKVNVESGRTPIRVNTGTLAVGNVPSGAKSAGDLSLTVPSDAEPGTYELPVEYEFGYTRSVKYGSNDPEYRDLTTTRDGTLEVTVDDGPAFQVVNRTSGAVVGQTGQVGVTLRNTGTETARDARVTITSGSPAMRFAGGSESATAYADEWEPGETETVTYEATIGEDADAGTHSADLSVRFTDEAGVDETSRTLTVGVPVGTEQEFALRDIESSLRAGYEGELRGTLVNRGPGTVRNPVATLQADSDDITITAPDDALSDMEPGDEQRVNFTVDVSRTATATSQQFELTVRYDTPLGDRREAAPLRPTVRVQPTRDRFAIEALDGQIAPGESQAMQFNVTNLGDEHLRNVEFKVYENSPIQSEDDEAIIGELAPDETRQVVFEISAAGSALEKDYPVEIDAQYERPDGTTELSKTYRALVTVVDDENGDGGIGLVVLLGVLALGVGGVFIYRRRSKSGI